jgi:hypothetical protein
LSGDWKRGALFGGKKSAPVRQVAKRTDRGLGFVVSCGGSGEKGWRTELELGSRKSLDDRHGAATFGTEPKRGRFLGKGGLGFGV